MNERQIIESTIDHLRFAECNCHRCGSDDIPSMIDASRELKAVLETFAGVRPTDLPPTGDVPEALSNFMAAREATVRLLSHSGHDMDVLDNIEAATRDLRAGFPA